MHTTVAMLTSIANENPLFLAALVFCAVNAILMFIGMSIQRKSESLIGDENWGSTVRLAGWTLRAGIFTAEIADLLFVGAAYLYGPDYILLAGVVYTIYIFCLLHLWNLFLEDKLQHEVRSEMISEIVQSHDIHNGWLDGVSISDSEFQERLDKARRSYRFR